MSSQNDAEVKEVVPSARRLSETLRDTGHDFNTALADLIDNCIVAGATEVKITARFNEGDPWIRIADNGRGMAPDVLNEALRFGSEVEEYAADDLGKFGIGLKTASHSQCRRLTVATRPRRDKPIHCRVHDLDHLSESNRWEIQVVSADSVPVRASEPLSRERVGTVVLWENLDRLRSYAAPAGKAARDGFNRRLEELNQYLGMVFHRFLDGTVPRRPRLRIWIENEVVSAWDPFCRDAAQTETWPEQQYEVHAGNLRGAALLTPFVLPTSHEFETRESHSAAGGRRGWNESQGLWIYRANRLIQDGGWCGLRKRDEHIKLARAAIDFAPEMDAAFRIDLGKMRVTLPDELRNDMKTFVSQWVSHANDRYRAGESEAAKARRRSGKTGKRTGGRSGRASSQTGKAGRRTATRIAVALEKAANNTDTVEALESIKTEVRRIDDRSASDLGWR
ncbi:MAG: ATP-binding protein [Acidimicrobiaceae bacterium]|nr:ATP-binding protein [Acidimicrobiaceae bacterium]MYG54696.1 ATP-binding protein [Acidimicrobiaceae bacterium]MYJ98768.1 ATP-binding protein [Acidimicrobiaceae bacterium]